MLEPAIRPVRTSSADQTSAPKQPFEKSDFDQLLKDAQEITLAKPVQTNTQKTQSAATQLPANVLSDLSRIDSVENASLRSILNANMTPNLKEAS
ncbi:hypothetical protein KS4_12180 [Poriferisphaera corsica]|uniref:Uncharacterized protein n=1 Tax=Poriferisphaera corsica TaxID=2528020 RepID=A0A517YSF8_9BACT|nr:hypothetical protein [Poriferisphaera corsica]QDU33173.1 hypothetical protein KS4_12180 [Poriferisphaera corsica]